MKKLNLILAAMLLSAFTFSSCLDDNDNTPVQYMSLVTIEHTMGYPMMYPDENPNQQFIVSNGDLTQYGISLNARRALITYTVPDNVIDWTLPTIDVTLQKDGCQDWPILNITDEHMVDTCSTYNSAIQSFTQYGVGHVIFPALNVVRNRYMNVGYTYRANKEGNFAMIPNRVSNDTVYFELKLKKEGDNRESGVRMNSYDLESAYNLLSKAVAKDDSLYVTVVALTTEKTQYQEEKRDSVTTRFKDIY